MSKLKLFDKKKSLLQRKKLYYQYDKKVLTDHKDDINLFKQSILEKFKNEYYKKNDMTLQIMYDTNIELLPGGSRIIKFYNNHGYKRDTTCFIINSRVDIHHELEKRFPGIHSKFSGKQVLISCLNDRNPIIKFDISRNNFKKVLYNIEIANEKVKSYKAK